MKKVVIFGATGSIGSSTINIIKTYPEKFKILAISCKSQIKTLKKLAEEFKVPYLAVEKEKDAVNLKKSLKYKAEIYYGDEGLKILATLKEADIFVIGISGIKALIPTYYSLQSGKRVAIANKESLIVAGEFLKKIAREYNTELIPVDSEHSSLFQLLQKEKRKNIKKLILTASGGPFYKTPLKKFSEITPEEAVSHPNWKMGAKISVDSATLMNKGFEVLEAKVLFDFPLEKIEVLIHPQSLVHGLIELIDGSFLMHLSYPDMKIAISYALNYPERIELPVKNINLAEIGNLIFEKPDFEKFPCLKLAYEVGNLGGLYPLILEAADEVIVEAFLNKKISFDKIPYFIEKTLKEFKIPSMNFEALDIFKILEIHKEICNFTQDLIRGQTK